MFFIILRLLGTIIVTAMCFYGYISWVRREEVRSELKQALGDIEFTLQQSEGIPEYKHERLRLARKKIKKIMGVRDDIQNKN